METSNQSETASSTTAVETDVLIVGTGPAGAALASFLGSHGIKGIIISKESSSAETPRAHITNAATFECLRDIDLEESLTRVATSLSEIRYTRWTYSLAGRELARAFSFGTDPRTAGEYELASPCQHWDLPQTLLDPALVRYASLHGFQVRWDTEFLSLQQTDTHVSVDVLDRMNKHKYTVRAKYVFGADGARSRIVDQLQLPLVQAPSGGSAVNVIVRADLSHLMRHREADLIWVVQPDCETLDFAAACCVRMVRPWTEWVFSFMPTPGTDITRHVDNAQYLPHIRRVIGDDTPIEILSVGVWRINDVYAERYSDRRVFCLGDAVHRHPPVNGLGSNTSIQDAFNLAWKVAYVLKNQAGPRLLESYSLERQPVGKGIVKRANEGLIPHGRIWQALGITSPDLSERVAAFRSLGAATSEGRERRLQLQSSLNATRHEFSGLGIEMNHDYTSSSAVYADTSASAPAAAVLANNPDPILHYTKSTVPGWRLPHVWLRTAIPGKPISSLDLAGKGAFSVFTGIGGEAWKAAAANVAERLGVPIRAVSIGWGQDYEDAHLEWEGLRGVQESGVILVRPDRFVAWRHDSVENDETWAEGKLLEAMRSILALDA